MGKQGIFLENRVQLSFIGGQLADICAVKNNFAGVSSFKAADNAEGCGLAAAAGAEKCDEFIFFNRKVQIIQNHCPVKAFGDVY